MNATGIGPWYESEWEKKRRLRRKNEEAQIASGLLPPIPSYPEISIITPEQADLVASQGWIDAVTTEISLTPERMSALQAGQSLIVVVGSDSEYGYPYVCLIRPSGLTSEWDL
jgi:hypothetical protein